MYLLDFYTFTKLNIQLHMIDVAHILGWPQALLSLVFFKNQPVFNQVYNSTTRAYFWLV